MTGWTVAATFCVVLQLAVVAWAGMALTQALHRIGHVGSGLAPLTARAELLSARLGELAERAVARRTRIGGQAPALSPPTGHR